MGDQNQRGAVLAVERKQQVGNSVAGFAVEVARRLIGKQHLRASVKRPGQRHALLLTAGKLRRKVVETFSQPQLFQQRSGVVAAFTGIFTAQQARQLDVFQRVQGWDKHEGLKHKPDMPGTQRGARLFIQRVKGLADKVHFPTAAVVQTGQDRQQRGLAGTGFTNEGDGFGTFDNEFNSGEDGKLVFSLTDGLLKTMNFNNVFRWHLPFLFLMLMTFRAAAADTLLILGDSLSAGYRMAASAAWPALLNDKWQSRTSVVNGSISGDTSQQGLSRLPALLKQHQPRWVLVELGGNDGLRGFQPQQTEQTLRTILQTIKAANARPLLMQIRLPANYGRRYNEAFSAIYPKLAKEFDIPLLPFFMEEVYLKPQWMQDDGIHPNRDAQPFIADWMATRLAPLVKHDSSNS